MFKPCCYTELTRTTRKGVKSMAVKHVDYSKIDFAEQGGDGSITHSDLENLLKMKDQYKDFQLLMMKYDCALSEVRTKLDVLNKELSLINNNSLSFCESNIVLSCG